MVDKLVFLVDGHRWQQADNSYVSNQPVQLLAQKSTEENQSNQETTSNETKLLSKHSKYSDLLYFQDYDSSRLLQSETGIA